MKYNAQLITNNIDLLLTSKQMNLAQLAKKLGITASTLYKKRNGKTLWNIKEVLLIAGIFNVTLNDLVLSKIVPFGTEQATAV